MIGSPGRARTADLVVNSHPLYRLSYRGIGSRYYFKIAFWVNMYRLIGPILACKRKRPAHQTSSLSRLMFRSLCADSGAHGRFNPADRLLKILHGGRKRDTYMPRGTEG